MKKLLLLIIFLSTIKIEAKGGIPILYSNGIEGEKVLDLPQRDEFTIQAENGNSYHADLGILHEQFSIFWIPLLNYGEEKYVLFTDKKVGDYDFLYADLDQDDIVYLQSIFGGIPSTPELPFWDAWGGKLLAFALIGILWFIGKTD